MNKLTSLYFDFARALAAIVVVFHHYSQHIIKAFHEGQTVFPPIGQEAVMVFFVLSGFLITWVAEVKDKNPVTFFIKRFSRFYSVMLPAIAILALCYLIVMQIDPNLYQYQGDGDFFWIKSALTLSFLNFNTIIYQAKLPGGAPFWSLTYEFWYYIIFALFIFVPKRWIAAIATGIIFCFLGIDPFLLWPVWLLGVATYWASKRVTWGQKTAAFLYLVSLLIMVGLVSSGWRYTYLSLDYHFGITWRYGSHCIYYFLLGLAMGLHFLALIAWSRGREIEIPTYIERPIRHVAGVSFTLYLIHVPVMLLMHAILGGYGIHYLLPTFTIALVIGIGPAIENSRFLYQKLFKSIAKRIPLTRKALG